LIFAFASTAGAASATLDDEHRHDPNHRSDCKQEKQPQPGQSSQGAPPGFGSCRRGRDHRLIRRRVPGHADAPGCPRNRTLTHLCDHEPRCNTVSMPADAALAVRLSIAALEDEPAGKPQEQHRWDGKHPHCPLPTTRSARCKKAKKKYGRRDRSRSGCPWVERKSRMRNVTTLAARSQPRKLKTTDA